MQNGHQYHCSAEEYVANIKDAVVFAPEPIEATHNECHKKEDSNYSTEVVPLVVAFPRNVSICPFPAATIRDDLFPDRLFLEGEPINDVADSM